jgi:hypothetical protein
MPDSPIFFDAAWSFKIVYSFSVKIAVIARSVATKQSLGFIEKDGFAARHAMLAASARNDHEKMTLNEYNLWLSVCDLGDVGPFSTC